MKEDNIPHPSHKNQDNDLTAQGNGDIKPEPEPKMSPLKAEEIPEKNFPRKKNELVNPGGDISPMEKYEPEKSSTQEERGEDGDLGELEKPQIIPKKKSSLNDPEEEIQYSTKDSANQGE
jgi:hypothetical protein